MSDNTPKFRREPAEQRKDDLIQATLSLIAEQGVRGATVRSIAQRADVTQGLIRHYFSSKEELIAAAYQHHMERMTAQVAAAANAVGGTAREHLSAFVENSLKHPVVNPSSVTVWASFLNMVREDRRMREMHEQTYYEFRDQLERLIKNALDEADIEVSPTTLRQMSIASNAVLDGLWLEGGALPGAFETGELPTIGLHSVGAIIGLKLKKETGRS